jgi:uncharacterized protein (TIGR04255 family)
MLAPWQETVTNDATRAMTSPIPEPAKLPVRINPCPIVEAVLEIRFVTGQAWSVLPGLLYTQLRDRYQPPRELDLAKFPEVFRDKEPTLRYQPLVQYTNAAFSVQLGPRVVSLSTKINEYPGWTALEAEMVLLLQHLKECGFISEGERLGTRYINFFAENVFERVLLDVCIRPDQPSTAERRTKTMTHGETSVTTGFREGPFTCRLHVANNVIVGQQQGDPRRGSVLDIDVGLGSLDFDPFVDGINRFSDAHHLEKQIFFGLLTPETLASLNPEY